MIQKIFDDIDALSCRSKEVDVRKNGQEVRQTVVDLKDTIRENNFQYLTAIQIGVPARIFVVNYNGKMQSYCNSVITKCSGMTLSRESSPVLPNKNFIVPRYAKIELTYQTPMGEIKSTSVVGKTASVIQQAQDQLEGVLPFDIGFEVDDDFDNATEDEQAQIIEMFLDSIDMKLSNIKEEINSDTDLKQISDAINFMEGVKSGKIELGESITEEGEVAQWVEE